MINITNKLNKFSLKLITKYKIVNQKKSYFLKEEEENATNKTNDSIKTKNSNSKKHLMKAIAFDE
jgi:hypothetical protein